MKKFLLSIACLSIAAGSWAQATDYSNFVDVTPTNFKFNTSKANINDLVYTNVGNALGLFNLGAANNITSNLDGEGKALFTTEGLESGTMFICGWAANSGNHVNISKGFSFYDMGGNIGQVLVFNGNKSELGNALKDNFSLTEAPEIPQSSVALNNNMPLFFLLNYLPFMENEFSRVRVRLELNVYTNDYTAEVPAIREFLFYGEDSADAVGETPEPIKFNDFAENGSWNPNKWLVLEEDFERGFLEEGLYIKLASGANDATIGGAYTNGALMIRNLEIYGIENAEDSEFPEANVLYTSWVDYSQTAPEVVDLYLIGDDVDGESWVLESNKMTYENGVYTWTGEYLGSAFKINNGTWSAEYNIGAPGDDLLTLGEPFTVTAGEATANIQLANNLIGVENPTVVYDPDAMTVTVTGTGVEQDLTDVVLYLRGDWNEWGTTDVMVQDSEIPTLYTITVPNVAEGKAVFKIADADWKDFNYGGTTMEVYSNNPGVQKLQNKGGNNINITNWKGGPMAVSFNIETLELTVEGADQPVDSTVGINGINTDNAQIEYYNLQGVKVANPEKGIFIMKQGNKTVKVVR